MDLNREMETQSHTPMPKTLTLRRPKDRVQSPKECPRRVQSAGTKALQRRVSFFEMSHNLNSLKGGYIGGYIGNYYRGY